MGVTDAAVIGWSKRDAAPTAYDHIKALIAYFGIESHETWFFTGKGEPPELALWTRWLAERRPDDASLVAEEDEIPAATSVVEPQQLEERTPSKRQRKPHGGRGA